MLSTTTALISSMSSSDSLTYINPLEIISILSAILSLSLSGITTTIRPSSDRCFLSLKTIFPMSPTPSPSTSILPEGT